VVDNEVLLEQNASERISHVEKLIDSIRIDLTGVKTDLAMLIGEIRPLAKRLDQPIQKPAYTAVISAAISGLLLLGAIGWSNLKPVENTIKIVSERQVAVEDFIRQQANEQSGLSAISEISEQRLFTLEEFVRDQATRQAATDAKATMLEIWIRDVDQNGSRQWVQTERSK
jgi:hypothetical protein